jgi:polysaccharide pyruvyl transferase WcaK-like protein
VTWPPGRPRILVTDCWLTNAGDAAIAVATQQLIERHAPGAAVLHAAYGSDLVGDRYRGLRFVPPLDALVGTRWSGSGLDPGLVAGADLVVSQGGGFLREEYEPWSRLDALDRVASSGTPLVLLGQTIGRFDLALARCMFQSVLRAAVAVVVRDPASVHHVLDLGADPARVVLGTDVALHLAPRLRSDEPEPPEADAPIAVVLSDYTVERDRARRHELAAAVLAAVTGALPDRAIEVWSSAQCAGDEQDEAIGAASVERLRAPDRERVRLVRTHVDAGQLLARTASAAAVVSMRLHPALLAAAQHTPALLVLDDQKTGVFEGTPLAATVVSGADAVAVSARVAARAASLPGSTPAGLGALPARLARTEDVLATAIDRL